MICGIVKGKLFYLGGSNILLKFIVKIQTKGEKMAIVNKEVDYILSRVMMLSCIKCKFAPGEYLLYRRGILFGGIYGNKLLIKATPTNRRYGLPKELPYVNSQPMYLIEDVDDKDFLDEIIDETCRGL